MKLCQRAVRRANTLGVCLGPLALTSIVAGCAGAKPEVTVAAPPPTGSITSSETSDQLVNAMPAIEKKTAKPAAKATKVRTVEGITEYRLDNGLQVLLFPDDTQSTVTVNITY